MSLYRMTARRVKKVLSWLLAIGVLAVLAVGIVYITRVL